MKAVDIELFNSFLNSKAKINSIPSRLSGSKNINKNKIMNM